MSGFGIPAALLAALTLLAGCATYDTARDGDRLVVTGPPPGVLRAGLGTLMGGGPDAPASDPAALRAAITPEFLAALPDPTLFAVLGDAVSLPQRITVTRGVETYLTEDGITLSTRDGMIVATRGLGFDVIESDVAETLAALRGGGVRASRDHSWLDGEGQLVRRSFDCEYSRGPAGIRERCYALGLSFENSYVTGRGRVLASRQWLGPVLGHIVLEQLTL